MVQLIVIILYQADTRITNDLFESISSHEYEHIDISLSTAGVNHKVVALTVSGNWNQLTRFKTRLSIIQEKHPIRVVVKEIDHISYPANSLPYEAYLTTTVNSFELYKVVQFFLNLPLELHHLSTTNYQAPITKADMIEVKLLLVATSECSINDYKESILQFCDENNFELILEPKKM